MVVADLAGLTCIADPAGAGAHRRPLPEPRAARRLRLGDDARAPRVRTRPGTASCAWSRSSTSVLKADWDAAHGGPGATPPSLSGQAFDLTLTGNRYGLPDFYSLHAWVWNPATRAACSPNGTRG